MKALSIRPETSRAAAMSDPICPTADDLLQRIHAGHLDPAKLSAADRRRCVEHLCEQAFASSEIATLLNVSPRTVRRDRAAIRRQGALAPDAALGDELLGEYERLAQTSNAHLARLARGPDTPANIRVRAERAIMLNFRDLIHTAQRLRYLEDGSRRLREQREASPEYAEQIRHRLATFAGLLQRR
jgi:transposase-like protein